MSGPNCGIARVPLHAFRLAPGLRRVLVLLSLVLAACASAPPQPAAHPYFADQLFQPPTAPIDPASVFAVSDEMRHYIDAEVVNEMGAKGRQRALAQALRSGAQLKLDYDSSYTRNAAEAFAARSGNCLSLVIMTAALAKQMGIEVSYHSVRDDDIWSRDGDMYFSVGHVNVTLGGKPPALGTRIDDGEQITIDFLPVRDIREYKWKLLKERTIVAMYLNNRAAESLAAGQIDDAYWYVRAAIQSDPNFATLFNTLGVVYLRRGHPERAETVLVHGLHGDPDNTTLMSNLSAAYARQGRHQQARELDAQIARIDPNPPFAWFNRGLLAMKAGEYAAARELFAAEVKRAPSSDEFHFWLGLALLQLGQTDAAREQLALAIANSTTRKDHDLYAAKLERIQAAQATGIR